jgi:hypothetical protein
MIRTPGALTPIPPRSPLDTGVTPSSGVSGLGSNPWPWVAASVALVALGLVVWWTAWLAWPAALVAMTLAVVRWRHPRDTSKRAQERE